MPVRYGRVGREQHNSANVADIYPSQYASGRFSPRSVNYGRDVPVAEDAEAHAVNCAQCNAFIEDSRDAGTCWHCGSDNFLGRQF